MSRRTHGNEEESHEEEGNQEGVVGFKEELQRQRRLRRIVERVAVSALQNALARSRRCREISGGSVLVGLSGGNDSLVTLDMCCKTFSRVEAFYMYLAKGVRCIEQHVEAAASRYGVPLHYVPHFDLSRMLKFGIYMPHVDGAEKLRLLKRIDVENALTRQTGIRWFAYGERASDSFARRLYVRENDGISQSKTGNPKLFPIWDWLDRDVYGFLRANKIPSPPTFGQSGRSTGFSLDKETLKWLRDKHPSDFAAVKNAFPYIEAAVFNG